MTSETVNACADCCWVVGVRSRPERWEEWKCHHENNIVNRGVHAVSGLSYITLKDGDILSVRVANCKGVWFEKYNQPEYPITPLPEKKKKLSDFTADDL